jgi:hypothetical protein
MKIIFEIEPQEVIQLQQAFVSNVMENWLAMQSQQFEQMMNFWMKPFLEFNNESHR